MPDYDEARQLVLREVRKFFKPEFLNRINDLIVFHNLTRDDLFKIVDLEIAKVQKRLEEKKITIELTDEAKALVIDNGYDEKYGARPLRRSIERLLEDPLAEALLSSEVNEGNSVTVDREDDALTFKTIEDVETASSESESS